MTERTSCEPEKVTAYVDGELAPAERALLEAHLAACTRCHDQEVFERGLHGRLRELPSPALPPRLAERVRARVRPSRARTFRHVWLAAAAGLVFGVLWARGAPGYVAWQLARDHVHCFSRERLPAQVWTNDPADVARWMAENGRHLPLVPPGAGGLELVGARFCPMLDRRVAHLYYSAGERHLSLYVVPGPVRVDRPYEDEPSDQVVHVRRAGGSTIALVSADPKAITAFRKAFERTVAGAAAPSAVALLRDVW